MCTVPERTSQKRCSTPAYATSQSLRHQIRIVTQFNLIYHSSHTHILVILAYGQHDNYYY